MTTLADLAPWAEIRRDDDGVLDEVLAEGCDVHLERQGPDEAVLILTSTSRQQVIIGLCALTGYGPPRPLDIAVIEGAPPS